MNPGDNNIILLPKVRDYFLAKPNSQIYDKMAVNKMFRCQHISGILTDRHIGSRQHWENHSIGRKDKLNSYITLPRETLKANTFATQSKDIYFGPLVYYQVRYS